MNITQLDLLIQDTPDLKQLILFDISRYNPDLEVENPVLEIIPPNFSTVYESSYEPLKANILDSNVLNWSNSPNAPDLVDLQDGLWTITQSVKPNGLLKRTYFHFRIVNLKSSILTKLNEVFCEKDEPWYKDIFILLQKLDAIKFMAENCGSTEEAKIMYNQILLEASKINCDC